MLTGESFHGDVLDGRSVKRGANEQIRRRPCPADTTTGEALAATVAARNRTLTGTTAMAAAVMRAADSSRRADRVDAEDSIRRSRCSAAGRGRPGCGAGRRRDFATMRPQDW